MEKVKRFSDVDKVLIKALAASGTSVAAIAKEREVSPDCIYRILKPKVKKSKDINKKKVGNCNVTELLELVDEHNIALEEIRQLLLAELDKGEAELNRIMAGLDSIPGMAFDDDDTTDPNSETEVIPV